MRVHALSSLRHYRRHVEAVWKHLDPSIQGEFISGSKATTKRLPPEDVVMVGGFYDIDRVPQRVVYVEHGAGQSYGGDQRAARHPAYHGSVHDPRVIGYISPSQSVADSWGRPAFAAGCPALDEIQRPEPDRFRRLNKVAAITFHWDARKVCPEARSARPHYIDDLHSMVAVLHQQGFEVLGHWHPRDIAGPKIWRFLGVEQVKEPDEVLARAGLLIADNTSLMYEAAQLDIPVAALNAPWYRPDVEHGLRFWSHVPGIQINDIEQFALFSFESYLHHDYSKSVRADCAKYAYALPVGGAGEAAALWLTKLVSEE